MTAVDWVILAFTALLAFYGYLRGFIVGALSLAGFILGAVLGTRLGPALLSQGSASPYAPLFGLGGALLCGAVLASGLERLGFGVRQRLRFPGLGVLDGLLGALLTACVGLGIAWVAGAVALQTPGVDRLRPAIQRSAVLQRLNQLLPPSGVILHALARFDPLPRVSGPEADVGPPRAAILRDARVRAARRSVVRVIGTACGLGVEGSGWVAAPGIVVTNAHVVAGEKDTSVEVGGAPPGLRAVAVHFDPRNDVAILRVAALRRPALPLARDLRPGTSAAILGYPHNGPYDAEPGRLGRARVVLTEDAYGRGPVSRELTPLRGRVRSGNSGGPMVDGRGRVVTTVFAATTSGGPRGGFGVPNPIVRAALRRAPGGRIVGAGPCAG